MTYRNCNFPVEYYNNFINIKLSPFPFCLHFMSLTSGLKFSFIQFSKGNELQTSTVDPNGRGLGDPNLLQSYFVCITESDSSTLIEYGKTLGTTDSGDIYLNMLDTEQRLNVRFYAFGNSDKKADVIDAHIVSRDLTKADCKGDTYLDLESMLCTQKCHEYCDPLQGMTTKKLNGQY